MLAKTTAAVLAAPTILILAACAVPRGAAAPATFDCALTAQATTGGTEVTGTITAAKDLSGTYTLNISQTGGGSNATIAQGGPFEAFAGETLTLGSVQLTGSGLSGALSITVGGTTTACPVTGSLIAD